MVDLRELDGENWLAFARMQLPGHQNEFVASNVMTIAESKFHPQQQVLGIYVDGEPAGLIAFCEDGELQPGDYWIYRFMMCPENQNKGYGKIAFNLAVQRAFGSGAKRVLTMCKPSNSVAYQMYIGAGFVEAGKLDDGDTLLELPLNKSVQPTASS